MWEEHPENQKQEARLLGVVLLLILVFFTFYFIAERDWDYLEGFLLFVGGIVIALGILVGFAWVLVKIFTTKRRDKSNIEDKRK